ncbi:chromosome segregation protein SMC [Nitrosovibrio sp. Nv17]|uniref:chromosome segregation protein SMC n=1 Tax=Nitrosovibrio sp. Nv17 TaxID=1855339 RepID=UPI00090867FE|nr:chromosome segregation protein SMC [Nitrosovibrio sp. Nv17]SFW18000.1 condensin subunit Smc [Nitrosovibrio sp. Nv17]
MRLSHIKLAGFKSFVDPTAIPVPGDLVGVVGPNGCGKSNIVDAVRWVLGESRASTLRGESMQDVIFNGSARRKPVGRASVELVFDNHLGRAAGQWSSYAEISIKRILHRDGESTYHINNVHVRRRDVTDIFLGTGIGGRGYAIIEQGMISRIIEAKPEELRVFLEEAAGVSKYRERRRETGLRLGDTRENLLRTGDIARELGTQLQRLEEQAEIASRHADMTSRLQTVQNLLWLARKREAAAQRATAEKGLHALQEAFELETANLRRAERRLEAQRVRHAAAGEGLQEAQGELYAANAEVAHLEQQIRHLRENRQRMEQQIAAMRGQLEHHEQQMREAAAGVTHWREEAERARVACEAARDEAMRESGNLPQAESALRACQERLAEVHRYLLLEEQSGRLEESHRAHAERILQQLAARQARLEAERAALPQTDIGELSLLHEQAEDIAAGLAQKQEALAHAERQLPAANAARQEQVRTVQDLEQRMTQAQARLAAMERLQQRLEGSQEMSAWLARQRLEAVPRLWQGIRIEAGWEDALEAVLRERLNGAGLARLEEAHGWLDDPPPAKWSLYEPEPFPVERAPAGTEARESWIPLRRYLTCASAGAEAVLGEWLGGVFAIEGVEAGLAQRARLEPGEALVTREGHVVTRHSLTYYAPDSQLHGVLVRQREMAQIEVEIGAFEARLAVEADALAQAQADCHALEVSVSRLRDESGGLQRIHHDVQMQRMKRTQAIEHVDRRRGQLEEELAEIDHQRVAETARIEEAQARLAGCQEQIGRLREQAGQEALARDAAEQRLQRQRRLAQDRERAAQGALFHEKACQNKILEMENAIRLVGENAGELRGNLERLQRDQCELDEAPLHERLQEWLSLQEQREQALAQARDELEQVSDDLRGMEQARMTSEQALHPLRDAMNEARLKEQEARIIEGQFETRLRDAGADEDALAQMLGKARPSSLQAEIDRLGAAIAALGAVNLGALEELQAAQARKTYLDSQVQDLTEAVETLESAIRRIDHETRARLLETVEQVNAHLDELFPVMFDGGQARLVLKGEEILDSGVQFLAQPPGKKNSSIHLLSGGEKALAALALVFSLFRLNPAPFCLLDEVDAPLDDSNTERFCNLVKKMSHQTQFLFISHNKITMEMAQQLIGVTMQEQGVSRVVAVEIEEAVRLGDAVMAT